MYVQRHVVNACYVACCVMLRGVLLCCRVLCYVMSYYDMLYDGKFYCGNNSCIQCINAYRKCIDVYNAMPCNVT